MSSAQQLPELKSFIADLRAIWSTNADNQSRMQKAKPALEKFAEEHENLHQSYLRTVQPHARPA